MVADCLFRDRIFTQVILDALPDHVAILDAEGTICAVNAAWRDFARQNGDRNADHTYIGTNYFEVCRRASMPESVEALSTLEGMQAVLQGTLDEFRLEYPCHSPERERWFLLHVTPIRTAPDDPPSGLLVRHIDITGRVLSERTAWQARAQQEINSLAHLNTLSAPNAGPLSRSQPQLFKKLAADYRTLLDQAVEQRPFGEWQGRSEALRRLAAQLGALYALPRDVIELHVDALRPLVTDQASLRAQIYAEEARLALLELMGYLMSFYRTYALGILHAALPNTHKED
ncbi:MAG: PAS domain-containing protein [Aggregatilineales bacterium]